MSNHYIVIIFLLFAIITGFKHRTRFMERQKKLSSPLSLVYAYVIQKKTAFEVKNINWEI